jgi:hypothetical protein
MKNKSIAEFYRQATTEELNFYENIFYPFQDKAFEMALEKVLS